MRNSIKSFSENQKDHIYCFSLVNKVSNFVIKGDLLHYAELSPCESVLPVTNDCILSCLFSVTSRIIFSRILPASKVKFFINESQHRLAPISQ